MLVAYFFRKNDGFFTGNGHRQANYLKTHGFIFLLFFHFLLDNHTANDYSCKHEKRTNKANRRNGNE